MNKKYIIAPVAAVVASVVLVFAAISPTQNKQSYSNSIKTEEDGTFHDKPTFMYFVTDDDMKTTGEMIERLEAEYSDKVAFEIMNISEDKTLVDKFPVKDNTPALIMLDKNSDIAQILFQTADYDKLKKTIEDTL